MKKEDGGPAHPAQLGKLSGKPVGDRGMTLRDWFAGQALAAWPVTDRTEDASDLAAKVYALADAMIAERAKGGA